MAVTTQDERKLEDGVITPPPSPKAGIHPGFYIALWIAMSSSVIVFNKWVLSSAKFGFPLFLTSWHMIFATIVTQIMARFTTILDSRHQVKMDVPIYMRAIVPIGIVFSLSLVFGNVAYLSLSVSFIQMLKATNVVATLIATWIFGMAAVNMTMLANVLVIVVGVAIASFGELKFQLIGFLFQCSGIVAEAVRLVMVQRLLSSADFKMDPLVSVYYYAPACAVVNSLLTAIFELPRMTIVDVQQLGLFTLLANAAVAFMLNVSVVLLIGKTSAVVLTMAGVLKDISLVMASMVVFGDPVTAQQFFGYAIALAGLVYYKLGPEKIQAIVGDARLSLNQARQSHPTRLKLVAICAVTGATILFLLGAWQQVGGGWETVSRHD